MGFISKLKAFFFNEQQVGIINIGDLIQIPGREYFKDNKEALDLIEEYKKECLEILSQKKTIVTKDISSNELINKKDMYINLLLNMVMKEDQYTYENQKLLDNKIILLKFKLYLEEIIKIENETIARLIALLELEKSRRVPIRNRNTLKTEIDNLKVSLYILISQKSSINKEIDNYLTHISISDDKINLEEIEKRKAKTIKYASYIMNVGKILSNDKLTDTHIYKQMVVIALLETKMEEYLYTNKPSMWNLNTLADSIKYTPDLNYQETKTIKDRLLHDLSELEDQYILYHKFGKHLVSYDDFYRLYSAKFRIITFDIAETDNASYIDTLIFRCNNDIENKVYADIIAEKKSQIFNGSNEMIKAISKKNGNENALEIIKLLSKYFKEDNTRFEAYGDDYYHHSLEALRLLLSLNSKEDFNRLLNRKVYTVYLPDKPCFEALKKGTVAETFTFADKVPISTILEAMDDINVPTYYKCLNKLYLMVKPVTEDYYYLPEGITFIDGFYHPYNSHLDKIITESKNKIIVMPSSLIKITGGLFSSENIKGVILNDGIKSIGYSVNLKSPDKVFDIPASLEECDKGGINIDKVETIRFKDYKNSKILQNSEQLSQLLLNSLICKTLNFKNHETYTSISYIDERVDADVKVIPKSLKNTVELGLPLDSLRYIVLEENGNDVIKIDLDEILVYGTLKKMREKRGHYGITKEFSLKYVKALLEAIDLETKKLEDNSKTKKKTK